MKSLWLRLFVGSTEMPTADRNTEECPRFNVLIVGQAESEKLPLINAVFETSLEDVSHDQVGIVDINQEITPRYNGCLTIRNFKLKHADEFGISRKTLAQWVQKKSVDQRLHAVWFCVAIGDPNSVCFNEKFFKFGGKVPTIVIFTKFGGQLGEQNGNIQDSAETKFRRRYGKVLDGNTTGQKRYTFVTTSQLETLQDLVNITIKGLGFEILDSSSMFGRLRSTFNRPSKRNQQARSSEAAQLALAAAQRVDKRVKVAASIKVGEKIWDAIAPDKPFSNANLENHVRSIHKQVVTIWNIRDLNGFLLSDGFYSRLTSIVEDLHRRINTGATQYDTTSGARSAETIDFCQGQQEILQYFVNLVLILQAIFQVLFPFGRQSKRKARKDVVNEVLSGFICSEQKGLVRNKITALVERRDSPPSSNDLRKEIELLINGNEIKTSDPPITQRCPLPSLLEILRIMSSPRNAINRFTLGFMDKLLESQDYLDVVSRLATPADTQLLFDFILCLLNSGRDADLNCKARKIFENLSKKDVLPSILFLTDVKTNITSTGVGSFGSILKGEHEEQPVALKVLYPDQAINIDAFSNDPLSKDFCRKALKWLSLSHTFIHPFLGVYKEHSCLYLVSHYATNKTLAEWRKEDQPGKVDIRNLMLEVAQGLKYIHSAGIVHGDLSTVNVLVDSESHCRITDFGLTRQIKSTLSSPATTDSINYDAPELAGICSKGCLFGCPGCPGHIKGGTTETDVYAYGCLYYAAFFDAVPFEGKKPAQIVQMLSSGEHPHRRDSPRMDDETWDIVEQCWSHNPSKRPTMIWIVANHTPQPEKLITTLIAELRRPGNSPINDLTIGHMRELLALSKFDGVGFRVTTQDAELLLDFILQLFRNCRLADSDSRSSQRGETQEARNLMFELISRTSDIPKPLFVTDILTEDFGAIGIKSLGTNFSGEHEGKQVVLKVVDKHPNFCREVLAWLSIKHQFISPLVGIFKHGSRLFLVSPFATNGTLSDWRRLRAPNFPDICRVLLQVAEGIRYIHSEGILHGNLHPGNILLDSDLRCQITDFGTRRSEYLYTQPKILFISRFTGPEVFGTCIMCGVSKCPGQCHPYEERYNDETMKTWGSNGKWMGSDVYAFGSIYYAIFFNINPFQEIGSDADIIGLVGSGKRPKRQQKPRMEDTTWRLIEKCWRPILSDRPKMAEVVRTLREETATYRNMELIVLSP